MLVQDIHSFLQSFTNVVIHHVFQQGNNVADWLAKYGLSILSTTRWISVPHRDLGRVLFEDNLRRTLEKRTS